MKREAITVDGNEAAARVAHKTNEICAIYPITPSSPMGEWADAWSAAGQPNLWGTIPVVVEMQSEGGASGAVHGALQTGSLTTTFTASQGLLLMIPNMFKIAGELTSTVFHVSARTVATHALSIFGDHSDVMAARSTGWGQLASGSIQEVQDFALIAQAATLEARVPLVHFFDGFRTSHEVMKIEALSDEEMMQVLDENLIRAHRERAMTPDRPVLRGSAQNPDVFFQARETVNPYYEACPAIVQKAMDKFAKVVGRRYNLFDYVGAPDPDKVVILMASGAETAHECVDYMVDQGEKVGVLKVRLYRPFSTEHFIKALPESVKSLVVLDRTKEPGALGEPLYQDVITSLAELQAAGELPFAGGMPKVIGGRYGLSSKEFTPSMVKASLDEGDKEKPKNHFTVGIRDNVTNNSLDYDESFSTEKDDVFRGLFYGLGSDGTVGANKNSIKIIGEGTDFHAQGYFVYDSKKSGALTVSHLRFGPDPIRSTYLVQEADFIACHNPVFLEKLDFLADAKENGIFLLNSPTPAEKVWDTLPKEAQTNIVNKKLRFYSIDAISVAKDAGMGNRINTIMQTCFFAISGVLERDEAIAKIKDSIKKTYGIKGDAIVSMNFAAVDKTLDNLHEVEVPGEVTATHFIPPPVSDKAPEFVQNVTAQIIAGKGDDLPVGSFPVDGTFPTGTAKWEKRNIALEIPIWDTEVCIQCGKCALACPHGTIRGKVYDRSLLKDAPQDFRYAEPRGKDFKSLLDDGVFSLQVAPEDCTGCGICVEICPAKNKKETRLKAINMEAQPPHREKEAEAWDFFLGLPEVDRRLVKTSAVKGSQILEPLFEFSGACDGCGETPYVKLVSQLFGDRTIIANATGCSSIYGGNLPTTPWTKNSDGRGPTWSNSLFEDNAEFGMGFRLSIDKQKEMAEELVQKFSGDLGDELVTAILKADQSDEPGIYEQRERVEELKKKLEKMSGPDVDRLRTLADYLVKKSVWVMGGDGWAYDIGFGGLDHVLASGRDVNVLVLDTEVYSNTGGQMSKATPRSAVAKFAAGGKPAPKKDLGMIAMTYGSIYVAQVAMGSNDTHTVKAFIEAEKYPGPSLIIAYSHCIAHGINMRLGMTNQKLAVDCGHWPLFRYNPDLAAQGKNPLSLDSKAPSIPFKQYSYGETRFKMLTKSKPEEAAKLLVEAQEDVDKRWRFYEQLASMSWAPETAETENPDQESDEGRA